MMNHTGNAVLSIASVSNGSILQMARFPKWHAETASRAEGREIAVSACCAWCALESTKRVASCTDFLSWQRQQQVSVWIIGSGSLVARCSICLVQPCSCWEFRSSLNTCRLEGLCCWGQVLQEWARQKLVSHFSVLLLGLRAIASFAKRLFPSCNIALNGRRVCKKVKICSCQWWWLSHYILKLVTVTI